MDFLKNIFNNKTELIKSNDQFWNWFLKNEKNFNNVVKQSKNIEKGFFDKLSPKLEELKDGYFFLAGMYDDDTVELVLTADGNIKNFVFVEELVNSAPAIDGWKFTALKPALSIDDMSIEMGGYEFNKDTISFYFTEFPNYPDLIDITIVHNDWTEENKSEIEIGTYIFMDNYLGELDFVTTIDSHRIAGKKEAKSDLIDISKLKDFLIWREKEFIEKYEGIWHISENDIYSILEGELENGNRLISVINSDVLNWDNKASHPWILTTLIKYNIEINNFGMPTKKSQQLLEEIENDISEELKDIDGYINIGRQTANGERTIYFACKDFRKPSKVLYAIQTKYSDLFEINYDIFKDKYWQTLERFKAN